MSNKFNLYGTAEQQHEVNKRIDQAIDEFVDEIKKIRSENPEVGIGDTHTDENISEEVFRRIHRPVEKL